MLLGGSPRALSPVHALRLPSNPPTKEKPMERKRQADRRSGRISELAQKSVTQLSQYQKGVNGLRDEKVRAVLTLLLVAAREREHRRARCVARLHGTRAVTMSF